jgi:hypothetical protein
MRCDAKAPEALFMIKAANNVVAERINVLPEIMHCRFQGVSSTICYHFVSRMCEAAIRSVQSGKNYVFASPDIVVSLAGGKC